MHLPPVQINRLERNMNELKNKIRRYHKRGNIIKVDLLQQKLSFMEDAMTQLRTYQRAA